MTDIGRREKGSSKRGTKGGSSRPGLQESLEELTRLADDLVDSLSDDETVDQAPAEQAAAEEIFLDLDDNSEEAVDVAIEEPADEVEAPEEFEVVEPSEQPPAAAASETEVPAVDDGAALQETLEELDLIGQQEPPAVQRFEVEFAGDKGHDIDAHLDTLFGSETSEQPPEPTPEPPTAVAVESAELSFEDLTDAEDDAETEVEAAPIEQVAVTPESRDVPEQQDVPEPAPSIFDEIEDPPRPAADTTDFHVALEGSESAVETVAASHEGSRSRKWLAVAAVFVVVAIVGSWMFFSRTSSDNAPVAPPSSQQASLVLPEPVASTPAEPVVSEVQPPSAVASEPAVPVAPPAKVAAPVEKPTPPPVKVAEPVKKPTPPPAKVAAPVEKSTPPPVKVAAPVKKPTPPPVKVAAPVEKPTPPPVKVAAPVEKPTPPPVKVAAPVEAAAPIEIAALVEIPTPAPVETEPAVPATPAAPPMRVEPPEVVTRIEPVLTKKARKEQGTVVLNVLVNESGRVVRVVVDEGIPGSPLEAASIDSVLRWKYRPGTENGNPVRAWVTETFVFGP